MINSKLFVGLDSSGCPGFLESEQGLNRELKEVAPFCIVAVVTNDIVSVKKATQEIERKYGNKKGKALHKDTKGVCIILKKYPLKFFILTYNKYNIPNSIVKKYKLICTSDSPKDLPYTLIWKKFSQHGWLTLDTIINSGFKGEIEWVFDNDLNGNLWE